MLLLVTSPIKLVEYGRLVAVRHTKSVNPFRVGFGVKISFSCFGLDLDRTVDRIAPDRANSILSFGHFGLRSDPRMDRLNRRPDCGTNLVMVFFKFWFWAFVNYNYLTSLRVRSMHIRNL